MRQRIDKREFSAARGLLLGFGGAVILISGLVGWSVLASVSGAVIATGWVAVEGRNQIIEHIDGGTVSEILVRDGDRVANDAVLLRFADEQLRSEEAILRSRYAELASWRNRLEAEYRGADSIVWDKDLAALAAADPAVREILNGQERLFRARVAARDSEVARLRERISQARNEIVGLEAQAVSLKEQRKLIEREVTQQRKLFEKGLAQLPRLLALERAAKNLEGSSGTAQARIASVRGKIAELEIQILHIDSRRVEEAEEQARSVSSQENQVRERLASVRRRLRGMEVRAPVAGEVFAMKVVAPGEVVRPGEPILQIVPIDTELVVLARLNPTDVDQVYPGQSALLRFSAFPARETPEFDGHVVRVSADAVRDPQTGFAWYEVELALGGVAETKGTTIRTRDKEPTYRPFGDLPVGPGMPVEVHVQTGERTVISYLMKPVTDFFYRSLREE